MELVLHHKPRGAVQVSFVLCDWSCRESLHILDYLARQTVPRDQFEIIWIEYYQKRSAELCGRIAAARAAEAPLPVDIYAILGMPGTAYYHKHLMYNLGILLAHGRIVCICDSDAFMRPSFVASILQAFANDPQIVLHLDEVRNNSRRFYPFNYPDFDEAVGPGCVNWVNGRPLGLSDRADPLHSRNYGAGMCACREDLIAIGGADMHLDYLGHICGPYELTFRLVNAGRREVWHPHEWLYHVWHPGQAGDGNYAGPHDDRHMSTTALMARQTGRVEPLVIHSAIARLRRGEVNLEPGVLLQQLVEPGWAQEWDVRQVPTTARSYRLGTRAIALRERLHKSAAVSLPAATEKVPLLERRLGPTARMRLFPLVFSLLRQQLQVKRQTARLRLPSGGLVPVTKERIRKIGAGLRFLKRMLEYDRHLIRVSWLHLCHLASLGQSEVALYGDGQAARILRRLARFVPIRLCAICPFSGSPRRYHGKAELWSEVQLAAYEGTVVVAAFVNASAHVQRLEQLGLPRDRLVVLH
jgi:hypothetical protein